MEKRTTSAYICALTYAKNQMGRCAVQNVMCDYEDALRAAIVNVFSDTDLNGCLFHYAQAVYRNAIKIKLMEGNIEAVYTLKMAMCLPLLPESLMPLGFEFIYSRLATPNELVFKSYMQRQWSRKNISVHRLQHRTNNSIESYHREVLRVIGNPHPNIWSFINSLKVIDHNKENDFWRLNNGVVAATPQRPKYAMNTQRIGNAQVKLDLDKDVPSFLRSLCRTMDTCYSICSAQPLSADSDVRYLF